MQRNRILVVAGLALAALFSLQAASHAQQKKPNILVIWGDDVGMYNISAYHRGLMGGSTPNIDRIAKEGILFIDHYGQASCTAGRAAFITGQYPIRVGLASVGLPGAEQGMNKKDPTIASLLKPLGYTTGQFGKNHLGDRDEHLPTNNGFDEFFGILYHLNAGEYVEQYDFPKEPGLAKKLAQRGVIHSWALPDGTQKVEDKGNFGQERQRVIEEEILAESSRFIKDAAKAKKPFFVWHNTTRTHYRTNLSSKWDGKSGYGLYADAMMELDNVVGTLLKTIDDLGIADNTMIMFATDNGAASNSWPDGGNQPFRGEKGVGGYEGGFKVPCMVKWPGVIPANSVSSEFMTMEDWLPTILSQVGQPDLKTKLLTSYKAGDRSYEKIHLDGYDLAPALKGEAKWPRSEFIYWTDDGSVAALRYNNWKVTFLEQQALGLKVWQEPFTPMRAPKLTNLRMDPFERSEQENAMGYQRWYAEHMFAIAPAGAYVGQWLQSFKEFPPRQKPGSFNLDRVMEAVMSNVGKQ